MMGWLLYVVSILAVSGLIGRHLGRFREAYTEMIGMMAGMTMGMLNGFVLGFGAAAATSSMFWGNLFGILLGLVLGIYFGRPGGLMGIMDGGMGGVMGGSMGAMLAVMVGFPQDAQFWTAVLLTALYGLGMIGLVLLIERSAPGHAALHRLAPFFTRAVAQEIAEVADAAPLAQVEQPSRTAPARPSGSIGSGAAPSRTRTTRSHSSPDSYVGRPPISRGRSSNQTPQQGKTGGSRPAGHRSAGQQQVRYAPTQRMPQRRSLPVAWVGGVVVIGILVALGWWVLSTGSSTPFGAGTNPGPTAAKLGAVASTSSTGGFQLSLAVDPDPPQPGPATFTLQVKDRNGQPVTEAQVRMSMDMTNMRMGPQTPQMVDLGSGKYQARADFDMGGPWRVNVDVSKDGQAPASAYFDLQVR